MAQVQLKHLPQYTFADYAQWEGDWELIHGIPYSMSPSPSKKHQQTSAKLFRAFDSALSGSNCQCEVLYELDWRISNNSIVRPDLMITCDHNDDLFQLVAPKLIVEILSESTAVKDKNLKFELYQANGVLYYIIVNSNSEIVDQFELVNGKYQPFTSNIFLIDDNCSIEVAWN